MVHPVRSVVVVAVLLMPTFVAAHPLGNFTINHYAGVRIETDRIIPSSYSISE